MANTKITNHVYQVGGAELTGPEDSAVYIIKNNEKTILIDSGTGVYHKQLIDNIESIPVDSKTINTLFLTHCHYDHVGGAKKLKNELKLQTIAHELDAPYIETGDNQVSAANWYYTTLTPCPIDLKIQGKLNEFMIGSLKIEAYHIPGHSPGSLVYLFYENNLKILFGQDIHGPLHPKILSNEKDYKASLELLINLEADILCEGHYGIYEGKEKVKNFITSYL